MNALEKYRIHLIVIAILVVLKFVLVPIFEWQTQQFNTVTKLQERLTKVEQVLSQQSQINQSELQVIEIKAAFEALYFDWQAPSQFRIEQQKAMTALLSGKQITIVNIGWQPEFKYLAAGLHREQMRLNIAADTSDIINFVKHLEYLKPLISIDYLDMRVKGLTADEQGRIEASLLLSFYMQEEGASDEI